MKIRIKDILYSFLIMLLVSGCDWLEVSPSNEVNEKDLFDKGSGYRNALNGIYLRLSDNSLYGRNLSYGFIEVLGHQYQLDYLKKTGTYYKTSQFLYDDADVKSAISALWLNGYNAIAGCNNLIHNISEADPAIFDGMEMEKNMIWGEALALRALIHFDLLRLFAPSMEADDGKMYIPYVDEYPVIGTTYYSNVEILKKIEADFKEARRLVAMCDIEQHPEWMQYDIRMRGEGTTDQLPKDVFYAFRGYRMNYYAITAWMARMYMWAKEYKAAFDCAEEVIESAYTGRAYFDFVNSSELSEDKKDSKSLVFTLAHSNTLMDEYKPFTNKNNDDLFLFSASAIYDDANKEDVRGKGDMIATVTDGYQCSRKYLIEEGNIGYDMIPMLRLSELYYIVAEYYARNSQLGEARDALDVVRHARGLMLKLPDLSSLDAFYTEMIKETRKELIGEGQLYFLYKRLNMKTPFDIEEKDVKFVFDRPENEDI